MTVGNPQEDKLHVFPTSGQPVTDTDVKEMLLPLKGAIQHDVREFMQKSKMELESLGERVERVENKMGDFSEAHHELVDAHFELEEELKQLKLKVKICKKNCCTKPLMKIK